MANTTIWVSASVLAMALAGCSGGDGNADVSSVSTSTQTNVGNTTVSGSISAGPGGGSAAGNVNDPNGNASMAWTYDNRTGTISGNGAIVNVPFEEEESFTVANGTSKLWLNLSAQGHELTLSVRAPDCDDDACAEDVPTQSGKASLDIQDPMEGEWVAVLQLEGTGPVEAEYTLAIAKFAPEAGA